MFDFQVLTHQYKERTSKLLNFQREAPPWSVLREKLNRDPENSPQNTADLHCTSHLRQEFVKCPEKFQKILIISREIFWKILKKRKVNVEEIR